MNCLQLEEGQDQHIKIDLHNQTIKSRPLDDGAQVVSLRSTYFD
jgi:hypothetical protein